MLWASLKFFNNDFLAKLNEPQYNNQIDFLQTSLMEYQKNICHVIEVKKKKRHPKVFKFALVLVSNYFNSNHFDSWQTKFLTHDHDPNFALYYSAQNSHLRYDHSDD